MINLRCFILQKRGCATTHILIRINLSDLYIFIARKSRITAIEAIKLTLQYRLTHKQSESHRSHKNRIYVKETASP